MPLGAHKNKPPQGFFKIFGGVFQKCLKIDPGRFFATGITNMPMGDLKKLTPHYPPRGDFSRLRPIRLKIDSLGYFDMGITNISSGAHKNKPH